MATRNPIDIILDPNSNENVVFYDSDDKPIEFEQVALIPIGKQLYCLLSPVEKQIFGLDKDQCFVFQIFTDKLREDSLLIISDENIINQVMSVYKELYEDNKKVKK